MLKLHIVIVSTCPGRIGPAIAKWFHEYTFESHDKFDASLVDLADFDLPVFNEPNHPLRRDYTHDATLRWSASVGAADAFVFVTPEYDYGMPPSLLNALIYLYHEWNYKPVAFVSYGGMSGGVRSVQMAKQVVNTLKMVPLPEAVAIPFVAKQINEDGAFLASELQLKAAADMLSELQRWAEALKPLRTSNKG